MAIKSHDSLVDTQRQRERVRERKDGREVESMATSGETIED